MDYCSSRAAELSSAPSRRCDGIARTGWISVADTVSEAIFVNGNRMARAVGFEFLAQCGDHGGSDLVFFVARASSRILVHGDFLAKSRRCFTGVATGAVPESSGRTF